MSTMTERLFQLSFFDYNPENDITPRDSSITVPETASDETENETFRPIPTTPLVVPSRPRRKIRDEDYRSAADYVPVDKSNPDP